MVGLLLPSSFSFETSQLIQNRINNLFFFLFENSPIYVEVYEKKSINTLFPQKKNNVFSEEL
jgi:hypothetical protein